MNNKKMPKTVTVKMKEIRKRPQKRNTGDVEKALKVTGTRNWHAIARNRTELRWNALKIKVHRNCRVQRGGKEEE
jgi:hypothetical protein